MLTVVREIRINAPREHVARYLRDLSRLAEYEPKVQACEADYPDDRSGRARVKGRFLGLPWQGEFEMRFSEEGGFQSRMTRGPLRHMEGGFRIRSVSGGVIVIHLEQYGFPLLLRPLYPLLRRWLVRAMDIELQLVKEGAERLHRQSQLDSLDACVRA